MTVIDILLADKLQNKTVRLLYMTNYNINRVESVLKHLKMVNFVVRN